MLEATALLYSQYAIVSKDLKLCVAPFFVDISLQTFSVPCDVNVHYCKYYIVAVCRIILNSNELLFWKHIITVLFFK